MTIEIENRNWKLNLKKNIKNRKGKLELKIKNKMCLPYEGSFVKYEKLFKN